MNVIEARLRPATLDEVAKAKGSWMWRVVNEPWNLSMRILGTWELLQKGTNPLTWTSPLPLQLAHRVKRYCGLAPELDFIKVLPSFYGTVNLVEGESKVCEAFLRENRHGDIFSGTRSMKVLLEILNETFPGTKFYPDSFIFTSKPESTDFYHSIMLKLLTGQRLNESQNEIKETTASYLRAWSRQGSEGDAVNISLQCRIFASDIISTIAFDGWIAEKAAFSNAINFINFYMLKKLNGRLSVSDKAEYWNILPNLRNAINQIIESSTFKNSPLFKACPDLSLEQNQALIFALLFAGQETVAGLLTYILWNLGRTNVLAELHAEKDKEVRLEKIRQLFNRSILEFTPIYGLTRVFKNDTCLHFRVEGEDFFRKHVFYKEESVVVMLHKLAQNAAKDCFPFGAGPHLCPGEALAKAQIIEMISQIAENYLVDTGQREDIGRVGMITLQLKDEVYVKFRKREKVG